LSLTGLWLAWYCTAVSDVTRSTACTSKLWSLKQLWRSSNRYWTYSLPASSVTICLWDIEGRNAFGGVLYESQPVVWRHVLYSWLQLSADTVRAVIWHVVGNYWKLHRCSDGDSWSSGLNGRWNGRLLCNTEVGTTGSLKIQVWAVTPCRSGALRALAVHGDERLRSLETSLRQPRRVSGTALWELQIRSADVTTLQQKHWAACRSSQRSRPWIIFLWIFTESCTGLFEMIVGVLTTCHTQYTWDSICIFLFNRTSFCYIPYRCSKPELKVRVRTASETITAHMLQTVCNELGYRVDVCRITKGAHREHL